MSREAQPCPASELICREGGEEIFSQGEKDVLGGYVVLKQMLGRLTPQP